MHIFAIVWLIYQTFFKADQQKSWFVTVISTAAKHACMQSRPAIVSDDTFVTFQPLREFPFLQKRKVIQVFPQMSTILLFTLVLMPYPVKTFCADIQFSRDSIHKFNDWMKIRESSGLWAVLNQNRSVNPRIIIYLVINSSCSLCTRSLKGS